MPRKNEKNVGEIREDITSGNFTIYAPSRGKRPRDFKHKTKKANKLPKWEKNCPFCPRNENMLPGILLELPEGKKQWKTRVVPNKYPALIPASKFKVKKKGIYNSFPSAGTHEVILETPVHNTNFSSMSIKDLSCVLNMYKTRFVQLINKKHTQYVIVFRNNGGSAGTSRIHPHSQITSMQFVPPFIEHREHIAKKFYNKHKKCIYCSILKKELKEKKRLVVSNKSFAAFVPYAAEVPCEVLIVPKVHKADFGSVTDTEIYLLAEILRSILTKLYKKLGNPDYNYIVFSSSKEKTNSSYLHWHIRIYPKLTIPAGFELGTKINVNPSLPETDARFLRN